MFLKWTDFIQQTNQRQQQTRIGSARQKSISVQWGTVERHRPRITSSLCVLTFNLTTVFGSPWEQGETASVQAVYHICSKRRTTYIENAFCARARAGTRDSSVYLLFLCASFLSIMTGTQFVSSVQSACSPQLQPVEKREKSQDSSFPGRWHVHFFCPGLQSHGCSKRIFLTRCLPKVVPPVFWMCRNTITSSPLMLNSTCRSRSLSEKLNLEGSFAGASSSRSWSL